MSAWCTCRCECGAPNCSGLLGNVAKGARAVDLLEDESDEDEAASGLFDVDEDGTMVKVTQLPELLQVRPCGL